MSTETKKYSVFNDQKALDNEQSAIGINTKLTKLNLNSIYCWFLHEGDLSTFINA